MRQRGDWMNPTDDQILEILDKSGIVLSPSIIAYNLGLDRAHVNRRLSEFVEKGFVTKIDRGKYEISQKGQDYLEGEHDASQYD